MTRLAASMFPIAAAGAARGYPELQDSLPALLQNTRQLIAGASFHSIEISQSRNHDNDR